jgi:signal transduction histidine kinase/GAF domain-containing protein
MLTSDNHSLVDAHRDPSAPLVEYILYRVLADVPAVLACVYIYNDDLAQLELFCTYPDHRPLFDPEGRIHEILALSIPALANDHICLKDHLEGTGLQSGIGFPLMMADETIGVLALFHDHPNAFPATEQAKVSEWLPLAETVLENRRLREDQNIAQTIQHIAQMMGDNPEPQDLVDSLHEKLCGPHISTCAMMFFGPLREDRPNGPFDYLEVRGTWSKRAGSGTGQGIKIYLEQYPEFLAQLDERKYAATTLDESVLYDYDPLIRGMLRAEEIRSMLWIALHAGKRRVGVMFVGSDQPHHFTTEEIRNYRAVSEFIAASTLTNQLQQQHDFVQRARAALLDAVTDGVMMVLSNTSGANKESAHILTVNQGFTHMFNINQASIQGLTIPQGLERMQIPRDARQELFARWNSISVRDTLSQSGEFSMMHPEGFPATIEWYSAPVHHENRVMGRMYIFHDVSATRTAANLRANFISRVSHELRTPLTSIRGFAEFMLEELRDELPDLAREYTEIILNSARHLNALFSDVIEIARADTGEMNLHLTDVYLPDVIIDVVALMELHYKGRGQVVIMELDDDLPPVQVDVNRITQVLTNLLSNAIKYTPPDTRIRIRTELLARPNHLPASCPSDIVIPAILVTMNDEGAGLSHEDAEQVFMPFYRTKEARADHVEGTGLGLTIARSIIELHRGKIWAEPRKRGRRGARFLFTLPAVVN